MSSFFAEFPVSNILRAEDLFNTALDWMSGIKGSGFYGDEKLRDIKFPDSRLFLLGAPGEEVNFDNISGDDETGFGFRHQISDNEGREWLTECVLHRSAQDNFLTVRVYCLQNKFGAVVEQPKRPFLIKMLLESGFGGRDIQLDVLDTPHRVPANAVEDAISLLRGHSTLALPVLYVSARSGGQYLVDVDKMSYDLGGLAHVVLEPNRRFSFSLREALDGENPYDGVLALIMPGLGVVKKYFPPAYRDSELNIASVIRRDISRITSDGPAKFGIDWAGLQAMFSRHARAALQNRDDESSVEEYMEAFDKEILAKNEEIDRFHPRCWESAIRSAGEYPGRADERISPALSNDL